MSQQNIWSNPVNPFQSFKVLCWYDRMKRIKTGNFAAPVNIALDLCQGTNKNKMCGGLKCTFCMSDFEDNSKVAKIPREILFAIPDFWREWGMPSVCLAGHHSDPLAYNHDDFIQFIRLLYKNDIESGIATNGLMFDENLIHDIVRYCAWTGFSVNAGTDKTFDKHTQTHNDSFQKIIGNIYRVTDYCKTYKIYHPVGYKFLITDDNFREIVDAVKVARDVGCRHFQIRPCELPEERSSKIDIKVVEDQIKEAIALEIPGTFEVFGIREKFTKDFKKQPPKRCIASPLGSTWKADGDVVICPDRRWSAHKEGFTLGNFIKDGLEGIRRKWGGQEHKRMIEEANKELKNCIRCTALAWHNLYENTVESDPMNIRLI